MGSLGALIDCWQMSEQHHDTQHIDTYIRLICELSINNSQFINTVCAIRLNAIILSVIMLCVFFIVLLNAFMLSSIMLKCHIVECHCVECCDRQNRLEILIIIKYSSLFCNCQHQNYAPKEFSSMGFCIWHPFLQPPPHKIKFQN